MKKLNFDLLDNVSLTIDNNELLSVSINKVFSWGLIKRKKAILDKTVDYIKKYYNDKENIENVIKNCDSLWQTLIDYVAEKNVNDFINQGFYKLSKEKLLEEYFGYIEPFYNEIQYLNDRYFDITDDEDQKQAYREARKENRSRIVGVGYGITGGIKASISAGLGNMASGMAHGAWNAIANGIGNISKSSKLYDLYNNEKTLKHLIDGWTKSFWLIIDYQVELLNAIIVEEGTTGILKYCELFKLKQNAETVYNNLKRIKDIEIEAIIENIGECIQEFPFDINYWKSIIDAFFLLGKINIEICNSFDYLFAQLGKYVDNLYFELVEVMADSMVRFYVKNINNNEAVRGISEVLDEKLKENAYSKSFNICVAEIIESENEYNDTVRCLLDLLYTLKNIDINNYKNQREIIEINKKYLKEIAYKYSKENSKIIIEAMENGNIDIVIKDIANDPKLEPDNVLTSVIKIINEKIKDTKDTTFSPIIIDNINLLKNKLNLKRNLEELVSYNKLREKLIPIEANESDKVSLIQKETEDLTYNKSDMNTDQSNTENKTMNTKITSQEDLDKFYNFLTEDNRIQKAMKFKERKGFFRHILPASWIITILFYGGFLSILNDILFSILNFEIFQDSILSNIYPALIFIMPIIFLIFGIKKRIKYIKEKKYWKDCTNNGKENIIDVFNKYHAMLDKYIDMDNSIDHNNNDTLPKKAQ